MLSHRFRRNSPGYVAQLSNRARHAQTSLLSTDAPAEGARLTTPTLAGGGMIHEIKEGDSLVPLAHAHDVKGWQLVAAQWHTDPKTGQSRCTPLGGLTGKRAPFLTGAAIRNRVRHLVLHPEAGPECVGRKAAVAIRPPLTVVGLDFDHGYSAASGKIKTGGDTLVNAEMTLGPLPPHVQPYCTRSLPAIPAGMVPQARGPHPL